MLPSFAVALDPMSVPWVVPGMLLAGFEVVRVVARNDRHALLTAKRDGATFGLWLVPVSQARELENARTRGAFPAAIASGVNDADAVAWLQLPETSLDELRVMLEAAPPLRAIVDAAAPPVVAIRPMPVIGNPKGSFYDAGLDRQRKPGPRPYVVGVVLGIVGMLIGALVAWWAFR